MADSKLTLPGDFQAGKAYLLKGDTLLAWRKALLKDRVIPGPGLLESATPAGRLLTALPASSPGICPFHAFQHSPGQLRINTGRLIADAASGDLVAITGLATDIALAANLKVSISVTLDVDFVVTGAAVGTASSWPADAVTWDGTAPYEYQTSALVKIGEVVAGVLPAATPGFQFALDGDLYYFHQLLHTHLFLALVAYDGKAALFPLAWAG